MTAYTLTVPVKFNDKDGNEKTTYRRVGVVFENHKRDTGEKYFSINLDFAVAVTEMVAFPLKPKDDEDGNVTDV